MPCGTRRRAASTRWLATDARVWAPAGSGHYATPGVGTPKTRSGKRDVPIPSEAERLLRRRYIAMGCPKKGLVFPSQTNPDVPVSARVLLTEFKRRMTAARLPATLTPTSPAASTATSSTEGPMLRRKRSRSSARRAPDRQPLEHPERVPETG
jgi:hypothetical protein